MSRTDYRPAYEYSFDEFAEHCDFFLRPSEHPRSSTERSDASKRYFEQHYPDQVEGRYKAIRFGLAVAYLQKHIASFEDFSVAGERHGLVTVPLMYALWRYYGAIPDQHLHDEPETDLIHELATDAQRDAKA